MSLPRIAAAAIAVVLLASLAATSAYAQAALPFKAYGSGLSAGQSVEAFNGTRSVGKATVDGTGNWVIDILPTDAQTGDVIKFTRDGQPTTGTITWASGQFTPPPGLTLSLAGPAAPSPAPAASASGGTPSTYAIQAGDTLYALALKWGTTSDAIAQLNGITDPSGLQIGQVIKVPGGASSAPSGTSTAGTNSGSPSTYAIVAGDNLYSLALKWGTTSDAIAQLNNITDPTTLQIGQVLKVPGGSSAAPTGTPASAGGSGTYTVVTGDNLSSLAAAWGTSVDKIMSLSGLTDPSKLSIGQVLKRP